jgi:hypothetical protein
MYSLANPNRYIDPFGLTAITFNIAKGSLTIDPEQPGRRPYTMSATSGREECQNNPNCQGDEGEGPIPAGEYTGNADELSDPTFIGDWIRNQLDGDWGDWRMRLHPNPGTDTLGRPGGFYLHGGQRPGTIGCVDVGGGIYGNDLTDRLRQDILVDPDGKIPFTVISGE